MTVLDLNFYHIYKIYLYRTEVNNFFQKKAWRHANIHIHEPYAHNN